MHLSSQYQVFDQALNAVDSVEFNDRGCEYGDGFFSTLLVINEKIQHWAFHWKRIESSLVRLFFPMLDEKQLFEAAQHFISNTAVHSNPCRILKIRISRGQGGAGYQPLPQPDIRIIFEQKPLQNDPSLSTTEVQTLGVCETPISENKTLVGLKHLNRLDNVLAKRELQHKGFHEGVMLNQQKQLVCATSANVLLHKDGGWWTPKLTSAGVEGTALAYLQTQADIKAVDLTLEDCEVADAICLTNAVRGVMPVHHYLQHAKSFVPTIELQTIWKRGLKS